MSIQLVYVLTEYCSIVSIIPIQPMNSLRIFYYAPFYYEKVNKILKKCFICQYIQKHPLNPTEVASLPSFRVSCEHAFENVGVDFVGPSYYNVGKNEMKKCYILLFTCAVSRAIHLELTTDVSADSNFSFKKIH